jgi:D-arginine dehydrogenase
LAGQGGYGVQTAPALSQATVALISGEVSVLMIDALTAIAPKRFL